MQPTERVFRVLNHEIPDCCPVLVRAMSQKTQNDYANNYEIAEEDEAFFWRDLSPLISLKIDAYDFNFPLKKPNIDVGKDKSIDQFGRISMHGAYTDGYIKSREVLENYPPFEAQDANDPIYFGQMVRGVGERIAIFALVRGLFELTWEGMGLAVFGRAQRKDPGFIDAVIDRIDELNIENVKAGLDNGLQFFSVADDMGYKNGLVTNKKFYDEYIFPRYRRMVDLIHKKGGKIYLHSEGNIAELMPSIIETGFDGVQGLTPMDGIDIAEIKAKYGDKIALLGGLLHSPMLDWYSSAEVVQEVKRVFHAAGYNGGLMMGPSAGIDNQCKIDNVLTMVKTIHAMRYE
jgi:uroporphyrinogen decarboxylase